MMNILIAGVGGQGSLLASQILGYVYGVQGFAVKVSEVHGMSQRGGSVVTYVRAGETVASPIIDRGETDMLIAMEQLEALRWSEYMRPGGDIVMSLMKILPMPVITGAAAYPEGIAQSLAERACCRVHAVDAAAIAAALGHVRVANVILLGAASRLLGFEETIWDSALKACVKPKFLELNRKAFAAGRDAMSESACSSESA